MAYAHSANDRGERHDLVEHLRGTAELAAEFAGAFGAGDLAHCLGLWHDLGKFHPDWQRYLLACETNPKLRGSGPDHKRAGAAFASERVGPAAMLVQGHHGGLHFPTEFQTWLREPPAQAAVSEALALARVAIDGLAAAGAPAVPEFAQQDAHTAEFFLRMLYSTLVDADFLDTERHFNADKAAIRGAMVSPADLFAGLEEDQREQFGAAPDTEVNRARREVYAHCLHAATQPPGVFRLAVPTGGGKTRSALAFALRHAALHGMARVIVAVPFLTITEQTADVYRGVFGMGDGERPIVLEHHSQALAMRAEGDATAPAELWARLAAENWDAPIVVTTTVQLFESLFAAGPKACRKLHRLAKSVIVLDEAQALPPHLLTPILDGVQQLTAHYGASVVISTATQPAFESIPIFRSVAASEIVPDPARYFRTLKRVDYDLRLDRTLDWGEAAALLRAEPQALAILNTKNDALALLEALDDPAALHLSTLLCGAHRRRVIAEVRRRLRAGEPCRLVATQVVEAGVDLDFPLALRALGPLDAIVQAAGRCNREGRLARGRAIVFRPADGGMPPGAYRLGAQVAEAILAHPGVDPADPDVPRAYFARLFESLNTDSKGIQQLRAGLDFPEVNRRFQMIEEETESVVVTNYGADADQREVRRAVERLRQGAPDARRLLRDMQLYTVAVRSREVQRYQREGLISPVMDGLGEWQGRYDRVTGLVAAIGDLVV